MKSFLLPFNANLHLVPQKAAKLKLKAHVILKVLTCDTSRVLENTFCGLGYFLAKNIEDYSK